MKKTSIKTMIFIVGGVVFATASNTSLAGQMTLEQVLQRSVDHQISLKIAQLQRQKSALETDKVSSMLGWTVGAQSSYSHDVGFTGAPADKINVIANAGRLLDSGDSISTSGVMNYEDSELALSPFLPNPSITSSWDVTYRKPLWQGRGNPGYAQGLKSAAASEKIALQQIDVTRDQIASQVIDLYFNLISTEKQISNLETGQARTTRLLNYIKGNEKLGLAETRDILQAQAQLQALKAETRALAVNKRRLITGLNRLMGGDIHRPIDVVFNKERIQATDSANLIQLAESYDPRIRIRQAQIELAQAAIERSRDQRQNKLDTLFSLGVRTSNGENSLGTTISEQDWAGSVGIEYQRTLDTRGKDASIRQAHLDKDIALEEIKSLREIIQYDIEALLSETDVTDAALRAYQQRLKVEKAKLKEGEDRYRKGRADTQQLILFENDLNTAQLLVTQQEIEQTRKRARLQLVTGQIWQDIVPLNKQGGGKP